jgi:hypothetical protein
MVIHGLRPRAQAFFLRWLSFCFCFALWSAQVGCTRAPVARPEADRAFEDSRQPRVVTGSELRSAELIQAAQVSCQSQDCPEAVAMLAAFEGNEAWSCSAFLVSPDTVATNSHCVPADLKAAGSSCSGRIRIHFPGGESLGCAQVLEASPLQAGQERPDFAFLKLSHPASGAPLELDGSGIADQDELEVFKLDPSHTPDQLRATLTRAHCRASMAPIFLPAYSDARNPVVAVSGCEIVPGNSGSPLLDAEGRVRGLIHATILKDHLEPLLTGTPHDALEPMAVATNFSCVPAPGSEQGTGRQSRPPSRCVPPAAGPLLPLALSAENPDVRSRTGSVISAWQRRGRAGLRWRLMRLPSEWKGTEKLVPAPVCYEREALDALPDAGELEIQVRAPVWDASLSLNAFAQPRHEIESVSRAGVEITVSLDAGQPGLLQALARARLDLIPLDLFKGALPPCASDAP